MIREVQRVLNLQLGKSDGVLAPQWESHFTSTH